MFDYIGRRLVLFVPTLIVVSIISFVLIQLPPGDYLTSYIIGLEMSGDEVDMQTIEFLNERYGLDKGIVEQYFGWIWNFVRGDMGMSFEANKQVSDLIGERLLLTFVISLSSLVFVFAVSIPIGIYSATHQYSVGD